MTTQTLDRLQSGTATIRGDPTFEDGPWTVHGVAQAAEVTQGVSGEQRFWPDETLRAAVDELVGTPLVMPDDHEDLDAAQPSPETIIGEVVDAAFDDSQGLLFEAEVDDPEIAKRIARGRVDVSPSVALAEGEFDEERDAQRVAEIVGYRDLAVVAEGAHASASVQMGPLAEALARQFDVDAESAASGEEQESSTGDGDDGPNEEATDGEGQSTPADDWRTSMSDDLTDKERELLAAAGQKDDPVVVEAEVRERLSDNEELIDEAAAMDSPTLVEEDDHEALQERLDTVESVFAEALQERTGLSDAAIEAMPFEAMAAEFETDDGDIDIEALTQEPEAGGRSPPEDEEPSEEVEALLDEEGFDDEDEAIETLQARYEQYQNASWESNAEQTAEQLETLGVEVDA